MQRHPEEHRVLTHNATTEFDIGSALWRMESFKINKQNLEEA